MGEAVGHVEEVDGTLVLRRIHVHFHLEVEEEYRGTADRVHRVFADHCPVFRSIAPAIEVTTSYEVVQGEEEEGGATTAETGETA